VTGASYSRVESPNPAMEFGNSCLDGISYPGKAAHKCSPLAAIRPIMHVPLFHIDDVPSPTSK